VKKLIASFLCMLAVQCIFAQEVKNKNLPAIDYKDGIGLNFIRPDLNHSGHYSFMNDWEWILNQYNELGVKWTRIAFSWVVIQPEKDVFDWTVYDKIVEKCNRDGIHILATLGGHFDSPPVPAWAGESLAKVVNTHPEYLENFVKKWVERYKDKIDYWEILNEPKSFHKGLSVMEYVEKILKPSYKIIKQIDPGSKVLPCAYNNLPMIGNKEDFWDAARGYYDIQNYHLYSFWGYLRFNSDAGPEIEEMQNFRNLMIKHGEKTKEFWVTETGWFGTSGIVGSLNYYYRNVPNISALDEMLLEYNKSHLHEDLNLKPYYTGDEIMKHSVTIREDSLCSFWMKDLYPRALSIEGCAKVFQWVVMDEFEDGYKPQAYYGKKVEGDTVQVKQVAIWALIGGDKKWRKSAYSLKEIINQQQK